MAKNWQGPHWSQPFEPRLQACKQLFTIDVIVPAQHTVVGTIIFAMIQDVAALLFPNAVHVLGMMMGMCR